MRNRLRTGSRGVLLFAIAAGLLLPSALSYVINGRVGASSEDTTSFTKDSDFDGGTYNNASASGNAVSLCDSPGCDEYMRTVTVDNIGGSQINSAEVEMTVNTQALINAGKMQSNCGDIRFTDSNQTTQLTSGNITNCDTTNTTIAVIVPSVPANTNYLIYMYYGSPAGNMTPYSGIQRQNLNSAVTTDPAPPATLTGNAYWDGTNDEVHLTDAVNGQSGALQYEDSPGSNFTFSTQFYDGGGTGADSIYLYMGANSTPSSENDDVGGFIFTYDEFQHYIGFQYDGQLLDYVYCSSPSSVTEISTAGVPNAQSSAACNVNSSSWQTAEVIQTNNSVEMLMNGSVIINYTSGSLPVATGPYMGWGARTGGSNDSHLIRDVDLTVNAGSTFTTSQTSVGNEVPATGGQSNASGMWTSPAIDVSRGSVFGDGTSSSNGLSFNLADIGSGASDAVQVAAKVGNSAASAETASATTLGTYTNANNGTINITNGTLTGDGINITSASDTYVVLVFTISQSSGTSPELSDVTLSYTPAPTVSVSSCAQLQAVDTGNPYSTYNLTQNIDCSGSASWNSNTGFIPIGTDISGGKFEGTLNGGGYTISGLAENRSGCYDGLFSQTEDATITNVKFSNFQITGNCDVGTLAGVAQGGTVSYVSSSNGTVDATDDIAGGLIGESELDGSSVPVTVETSSYTGTVTSTNNQAGGLIGTTTAVNITNAYANATVSGTTLVGGLVGVNSSGVLTITNAYAAGTVTAISGDSGGLAGLDASADITNSFSAAKVTDPGISNGALVGQDGSSSASWSGDYYDQVLSTQSSCIGQTTSGNTCTAVDTSGTPNSSYFFNNTTNTPLNQWNFHTVWYVLGSSYPILLPGGTHTTLPVIHLYGDNPMYLGKGSVFTDPGAYVTDSDQFVSMGQIAQSNDVNTNQPGTYVVTYNVADEFGNAAVPATRTVIVTTPVSATTSSVTTSMATSSNTAATSDASGPIYLDPFTNFTDGSGHEVTATPGQEYIFTATNDSGQTSTHTLTVDSLDYDNAGDPTVTLTLHSTPQTFSMYTGQTVLKNVTGGDHSNIGITVDRITSDNVSLTVWDIQPSVPKETIALASTNKNRNIWWYVIAVLVVIGLWFIVYKRRRRKDDDDDRSFS
jgi:hypothetical protein